MTSVNLDFISCILSTAEIRADMALFNRYARQNADRSRRILVSTQYWLHDAETKIFAPSKFVGYRRMDFATYDTALTEEVAGARFDGTTARQAIEECCHIAFAPNSELTDSLVGWAEALLYPSVLNGVNQKKWRFLSLR